MKQFLIAAAAIVVSGSALATPADDMKAVAELDTRYQAAVKANDADTMAQILAPDFVLALGNGKTFTTKELLDSARTKSTTYEHQEEEAGTQTVRVWGVVAVVTAKLWLKGTSAGKAFERKLWFSDTYRKTPGGWRYVFGQASLPLLPETAPSP
jgi:ketosteroid isomerase-like protein